MASEATQRRLRLVVPGMFFTVVAVLVLLVIPPVATETFRSATPRAACIAFALLHAILGLFALRSSRSSGRAPVWAGVCGLILGLILLDGAFAFTGHGAPLRLVAVGMFACVSSDFLAAGWIFALAIAEERAQAKLIRLFP